jgi:hypothetical protein
MEELKGFSDISIRFNSSKNNIQINSKLTGNQNVNFQEILTNVGDSNQGSVINNSNQNINLESLQSQSNENELSQSNDNKNINNDKNASTSIKSDSNKSSQTKIFSEYIPQKPVEVDSKNLNLHNKPQKENILIKKTIKLTNKVNKSKTIQSNSLEIIVRRESKNSGLAHNEEDSKKNSVVNKKENNVLENIILKNNYTDDKEEQRKKQNTFYYDDQEINDQDISKILESYGLEIPEFLSKGGDNRDENWVKNLIFGSVKENLNSEDSEKIAKFIAIKNPEQIAEKDKKVFTKLVNEIFKHQVNNINPEIFSRFEKNSSEFILKNFPHIIYNGVLKKYFDVDSDKAKNSRLKMLVSFINNEKINDDDIKNSGLYSNFEDNEKENIDYLLKGEYNKLNNEEIYKSINKSKDLGISFGGFIDNVHQIVIESYENKLNQKLKQTIKILSDYRQYNFINENDSHFLSSNIVNTHFQSTNISQNKLTEIMTNLINGEYIEPVYLDLINQSFSKNLLSYLPNTINYQVADYIKGLPFSKNEVIIDEDKELFKLFIKIKFYQKIKSINILNNDTLEILNFKITGKNILFTDLEISAYKIKSIENEDSQIIELSKFDKNFNLDFSVDKKIDIFYFGTLEIKNVKNNDLLSFKLKNEYQSFLSSYKKKSPEFFKDTILKVNPKLFK